MHFRPSIIATVSLPLLFLGRYKGDMEIQRRETASASHFFAATIVVRAIWTPAAQLPRLRAHPYYWGCLFGAWTGVFFCFVVWLFVVCCSSSTPVCNKSFGHTPCVCIQQPPISGCIACHKYDFHTGWMGWQQIAGQ